MSGGCIQSPVCGARIATGEDDGRWRSQAACFSLGELFWPDGDSMNRHRILAEAVKLCRSFPVVGIRELRLSVIPAPAIAR